MKHIYKNKWLIIAIVLLIAVVSFWFLFNDELHRYSSPDEFAEKSTDSVCNYNVIAQEDYYAVCMKSNFNDNTFEYYILSRTEKGKWKVLKNHFNYEENSYDNMNINADFHNIYAFRIKDYNKKIIIVWKFVGSEKYGENVFNKNDTEMLIYDSKNTSFYYYSMQHIKLNVLYVCYTGFIDNFDENNYVLNINGKQYPYKEWKNSSND